MDVATLGLAVDSSQADKGTLALTKLTTAAKRAEVATARAAHAQASAALAAARASDTASKADVQAALAAKRKAAANLEAARAAAAQSAADHATAQAASAAAAAMNAEATSATKAAGSLRQHAAAVNDNARRMSGSMSGLAAQFQDIGVTAAMGMNPAIIALQQGTQIAGQMEMAMQSGGSAVGVLGAAFKSLFSPLTFITIALTALAAVGLQLVDWPALAASALNALGAVLQTIAPYATLAAAALALLYAPQIILGIVSVIAMLGRLAVAAVTAAAAMAAANPAAAFVLGVTAAVAAANIFRDELTQIFGVDIVGAAKTGANLVIGSFVAAFEDVKFVWNTFPSIVGSAAIGAANAVIGGMNAMISKATELLNGFIAKVNGMLSSLPFGIGEGVALPGIGDLSIGSIKDTFASQVSSAVVARNTAVQGALSRDYLGDFGGAISRGASAASAKLKELAKDLVTVDEKAKKKGGKSEADKYQDIVDGANRRIESLRAEQEALGLTEFAAAKLRYETQLLNEAQQKGITLSDAQKGALSTLAGTMAGLEIATKKTKDAIDFSKDLVKGFVSDLRSGLEQGKSFWESFGKAALNVLDKIIDKLLNNLIDAIFEVNSASGSSGGGGFFGSLFGWIGKLFGFAKGGVFSGGNVVPFAKGGVVTKPTVFPFAKGAGLMGEAGPEAIMPLRRGPDGRLGVVAANQNGGSTDTVHIVLQDDSGRMAEVADQRIRTASGTIVQVSVQQSLKATKQQMPGLIANAQTRQM